MKIPKYNEIHLSNAPINEVICQIKFPSILRIKTEEPTNFQEIIRDKYPLTYSQKEKKTEIENWTDQLIGYEYKFTDKNEENSLTLASDFFALTTKKYISWERYSNDLLFCSQAINDIYKLPFLTRIGLRFINFIDPKKIGVAEFDEIFTIINEKLISDFTFTELPKPSASIHRVVFTDAVNTLVMQYGKVIIDTQNNVVFVLDIDTFIENKIDIADVSEICEQFHNQIYGIFRWSIKENSLSVFNSEK